MEVVIPQEMSAVMDGLREVLEEGFTSMSVKMRARPVENYFTRDEAAEHLRMSSRMLDGLCEEGTIRRAKLREVRKSKVLF